MSSLEAITQAKGKISFLARLNGTEANFSGEDVNLCCHLEVIIRPKGEEKFNYCPLKE
jgi:hypothetical protein